MEIENWIFAMVMPQQRNGKQWSVASGQWWLVAGKKEDH
jgi:hypothetical protein